jgi:hypothetical protein
MRKPEALNATRFSSPSERMAAVLGVLIEKNDLRQIAELGSLLDSLEPKQWRTLLDQVEGFPQTERERLLPRLVDIWTRLDPKAATDWIRPRLDAFPRGHDTAMRVEWRSWRFVDAWASNAPEAAIEYALKLDAHADLRNVLINSATFNRADKDYAKAFESLRGISDAFGGGVSMSGVASLWAATNRQAALAAAVSLPPGQQREEALSGVALACASTDPAEALELAARENIDKPMTLARIIEAAAKCDPAQAAACLEKNGQADGGFKAHALAITWAQHDPAAALAWAQAHGVPIAAPINRQMVGGMFNNTGESPLAAAIGKNPAAAVAFVEAMPPGDERNLCMQFLIPMITDVGKISSFINSLPSEAAADIIGPTARILFRRDKEKALAWVGTLSGDARKDAWLQIGINVSDWRQDSTPPPPPGPDRDAMISGMASANATFKPENALNKAIEISDPALRQQTLHYIFAEVSRSVDEERKRVAREWLENANVPLEWKQKWNQMSISPQ